MKATYYITYLRRLKNSSIKVFKYIGNTMTILSFIVNPLNILCFLLIITNQKDNSSLLYFYVKNTLNEFIFTSVCRRSKTKKSGLFSRSVGMSWKVLFMRRSNELYTYEKSRFRMGMRLTNCHNDAHIDPSDSPIRARHTQ